MEETTSEVAVIVDDGEPRRKMQVWAILLSIFAPGKGQRRVWDLVAKLEQEKMELRTANETLVAANDELQEEINHLKNEVNGLAEEVEDVTRRLKAALTANKQNLAATSFTFHEREISGHEDVATHPVNVRELLSDDLVVHPTLESFVWPSVERPQIESSEPPESPVETQSTRPAQPSIDATQELFAADVPFVNVSAVAKVTAVYSRRQSWVADEATQVLPLHESPLANPANVPGMTR